MPTRIEAPSDCPAQSFLKFTKLETHSMQNLSKAHGTNLNWKSESNTTWSTCLKKNHNKNPKVQWNGIGTSKPEIGWHEDEKPEIINLIYS